MDAENRGLLAADYTVCMYVRLSVEDADTDEVKKESNSITAQRQLIRDYLDSHPEFARCRVIERCDDGFSGTNFNRPDFATMLRDIQRGLIGTVIVKDLSIC